MSKGLAVEPIVRVRTRRPRLSPVFSGLTAALLLSLAANTVHAQPEASPPPAAAESAPQPATTPAPAPDEPKYDPPLTDAARITDWERTQKGELRFKEKLKLDRLSNADKEVLTGAVQHYLYLMTIPEQRPNLHGIVQKLVDTVNSKQLTTLDARNFVNSEIVRIAPELLGQHPDVRLNVLILAASLISDPGTNPPRPYADATPLFLNVLDDPGQTVGAKIWAANGLRRICRDGDIPVTLRDTIAKHLVAALAAPDSIAPENWWYRLRIIDALGETQLVYNLQREPIVIDSLVGVLSSRKENMMVRATAARCVTQLPWQPSDQVNVPLVTYLVCDYAREVAVARNSSLKAPHWEYCILWSYFAFNPQTAEHKAKNWGLLQKVKQSGYTQHQQLVEAAYRALLPAVNTVMKGGDPVPVSPEQLKPLEDWLKDNIPEDRRATPSSKQVDPTEQNKPRTTARAVE